MTRPASGPRGQRSGRSFIRVGGPVLIVIGLLLTIAGLASFFGSFGSFDGMPNNFWMAFIGLPLIAIGVAMTSVAYLGAASRYVAGEVTPAIRDTLGALGVSNGETCAACGATNDAEARFCDSCGKPLSAQCAACGATNDAGARFCDACGAVLPAS